MPRTMTLGLLAIATVCVYSSPADARGHGHHHAHHARVHVHRSIQRVIVEHHIEHHVRMRSECGYERSVCAEECRLGSAAACERCEQEVALCEGAIPR